MKRSSYLYLFRQIFRGQKLKWEDVTKNARAVSLSATGKRAIMEARGEIFTIPVEHGDARNMTLSSGAADHAPVWSPKGNEVAWFSDVDGKGYALMIAAQDGMTKPRSISIGESKMAWEPTWSPDGKLIAFADDDVSMRIVEVATGAIKTIDVGGANIERGDMGLTWSPDSKWLAYSKSGSNNFRQIIVWSAKDNNTHSVTKFFCRFALTRLGSRWPSSLFFSKYRTCTCFGLGQYQFYDGRS
ncbi:MAG: hypothetical protein U5K54_16355 [Cytophagales bacterium]|nr:hypothetical protein [Cytophagales bacterium]